MIKYKALSNTESGEITIFTDRIDFHFSDTSKEGFSIPNSAIDIQVFGVNSAQFLLKHRTDNSKTIVIQDEKAIQLLSQYGLKSAQMALNKGRKKKIISYSIVGGSLLSTVFILFVIPWTASILPTSWLNSLVPPSREAYLGRFFTESLSLGHSTEAKNPNDSERSLQKILEIFEAENPELMKFNIAIYKQRDDLVNAFAAPGSIILVNSGLIEKAESVHEVVGVIAHEIGHVLERHPMRLLIRNGGVIAGFGTLGTLIGFDSIKYLGGIEQLLYLKNSRKHETEADELGIQLLKNAKLSTHGLKSFFEKLHKENEEDLPSVAKNTLSLLSTHPLSEERIKNIEKLTINPSDISNDQKLPTLEDLKLFPL